MSELPHILLVEDDEALAGLVATFLGDNGFRVSIEGRGDRAAARVFAERPDLVVLDVMLPGRDGHAVCRELRPRWRGPILVLTARGDEIDEVLALELGADDFMQKPVRPRVLLAHVRSLLRRGTPVATGKIRDLGRLHVDPETRRVRLDGELVDLTTAEFDLLWALVERAGEVIERDDLYQRVRGIAWDGVDRSIDLRVSRLRRKLKDESQELIKSIRGTGYLLAAAR